MFCYLVKGNITLLLFMQNAIIKYKGLPIIVIVVLHFNNLGILVFGGPGNLCSLYSWCLPR